MTCFISEASLVLHRAESEDRITKMNLIQTQGKN